MYLLLIVLHILFLYGVYSLHNWILFLFFVFSFGVLLFYFSPFFFLGQQHTIPKDNNTTLLENIRGFFLSFSPVIYPIVLFYIAIYLFIYAVFSDPSGIMWYHSGVIILVYLFVWGYYIWTQRFSLFIVQILKYHTLFVFGSGLIYFLVTLFSVGGVNSFFLVLLGFALLVGFFLFFYGSVYLTHQEYSFYLFWILGLYSFFGLFSLDFFGANASIQILILFLVSLLVFFFLPEIHSFRPYSLFSRYIGVFGVYFSMLLIYIFLYFSTPFPFLLIFSIVAILFVIHRKYENYISYFCALGNIFFLYSAVFGGLLSAGLLSALLFIFFLSLVLLGGSFFWRPRYSLDFPILHGGVIIFSVITSVYYLFIWVEIQSFLFTASLLLFGITLLAFLSYFRLHVQKQFIIPDRI